jgi:subtilisin-like proprotein convertase family protein
MKEIFKVVALFFIVVIFSQCSKSNGNSDGIPLVKDNGGQVGFSNETPTVIEAGAGKGSGGTVLTISKIIVPISGVITDKNKFILELNIDHLNQEKISLVLVAPNGSAFRFVDKAGSAPGKYIGANKLRFSAAFINALPNNGIDFPAGDYKESENLVNIPNPITLAPIFSFIQGTSIQGEWQLRIYDTSDVENGRLISWRLIFN